MNEHPRHRPAVEPARSFDLVADAYDRARPSYPEEAVAWLVDGARRTPGTTEVLELGAGTGKLTEQLLGRGCSVTATDPSEAMLSRLVRRAPQARALAGAAEQIPVGPRSADLVVAAQAFHWFDTARTLHEVARVLRPGGRLAVVWNARDERIPWVKRLGRIIGTTDQADDPTAAIDETGMFETVERTAFRFWQPLSRESLRDLVVSRSHVAVMSDFERERVLRKVDELYAEYGRGPDGMLLPYVTTACRTAVLPWALPPEPADGHTAGHAAGHTAGQAAGHVAKPAGGGTVEGDLPGSSDDDSLLIDFR